MRTPAQQERLEALKLGVIEHLPCFNEFDDDADYEIEIEAIKAITTLKGLTDHTMGYECWDSEADLAEFFVNILVGPDGDEDYLLEHMIKERT